MVQNPHFHEGTARELVPYLVQHPRQRFRLIALSMEETELPNDGDLQEEEQNLAPMFAELIEAAKHVERNAPRPPTDPHEVDYRTALQEKYRKMGLHP